MGFVDVLIRKVLAAVCISGRQFFYFIVAQLFTDDYVLMRFRIFVRLHVLLDDNLQGMYFGLVHLLQFLCKLRPLTTNLSAVVRRASPNCRLSAVASPLQSSSSSFSVVFTSFSTVLHFTAFCTTMSAPVNKFYHPGACRLVDAYFKLNMAW